MNELSSSNEKLLNVAGLDALTEKVSTTRSSEDPSYYCELCDSDFDMDGAFHHVTSTQHRFLFLVSSCSNCAFLNGR